MTDNEIFEGIRIILEQRLHIQAPLSPATDLRSDLQLDSLAFLSLMVEIENRFKICLNPEDEGQDSRIAYLVQVVQKELAHAHAD